MSDGSKATSVCVAVLMGGLLPPTTENNLTTSLNSDDDHLTGKWTFAIKLDMADAVKQSNAQIGRKGCCPKSCFYFNFQ